MKKYTTRQLKELVKIGAASTLRTLSAQQPSQSGTTK